MEGKTKKNIIYSPKNAFNVIVNLHIIYRIYRGMGKQKADAFTNVDFYGAVMDISRMRFGRIRDGENFIISKEERKYLSELFNIEETYFCEGGDMIAVHRIDETDWKCYFNCRHGYNFEMGITGKTMEERANMVDDTIKQSIQKKLIESTYDVSEPLFKIYYYFKNNTPYRDETQLTKFTRELSKLKISDWDEIIEDVNQLSRYEEMLDKHSKYIQAVLTYINYRK